MAILDSRTDRVDPRIPFFTPVVTSRMRRCWATNLSGSGIGIAGYTVGSLPLIRGDEIELQFELGETKRSLTLSGRVSWASVMRSDGRVGLGVQFTELPAAIRGTLARFIAEHRPRVLVVLADREAQQLARKSLAHLDLEFVSELDQLDDEMLRSSATIIAFAEREDAVATLIEALSSLATSTALPNELPVAPITLCTSLDSDHLLPLFRAGKVYEVLRMPLDPRVFTLAVDRSCERWALQQELRWASLQLEGQRTATPAPKERPRGSRPIKVVKISPAMRRVYELINTVAVHDVPVLLTGETGTGKELAAREIHALSRRANTPFIAQDCGALTETLLESELFGHVRGAFTGASSDHPGLFQIADGGTIFLDEIQNTSPSLQAKLLRVVEEGEVRPVGGSRARQVNVRLLAACNVDLRTAVKEQRFRSDFFYRINRFPIELPPLREHPDDILPLVRFFLTSLCETMAREIPKMELGVERMLVAYDWPGNIRELRNAVERALLLTPHGADIAVDALPDDVRAGAAPPPASAGKGLITQLDDFERSLIRDALARHANVVRRAARELDINAVTLARRMRRLGLGDDD